MNICQLQLGSQRQIWLIFLVDEMQNVQIKLCYPLTVRAIPERLTDASCGEAYTNRLPYLYTSLVYLIKLIFGKHDLRVILTLKGKVLQSLMPDIHFCKYLSIFTNI